MVNPTTHGLGLHFFNTAPAPSGQQYTGISVAQAAIARIPEAQINNNTDALTIAAAPPTVCVNTCLSQSFFFTCVYWEGKVLL
jgi:hypothetical protein